MRHLSCNKPLHLSRNFYVYFPYIEVQCKHSPTLISKELVGASARPILLSILAEGESYGYAIIQRVHDLSSGELAWKDGTLYPVLHRLADAGLITADLA